MIAVFLEQITVNTCRAFQLLEAVISSASRQIATFWLKDFVNIKLKLFWKITVNLRLAKLIHY